MSHTLTRTLVVDAADESTFRPVNGVGGVPGPAEGYPEFPDMTPLWREAGVTVVRSFDWVSRLDTRDNPTSLFPDWSADPDDPASYNFTATDQWVDSVHAIGAEVMFTVASSIPRNKLPAEDVELYGRVVEHIVRHYSQGWAGGPRSRSGSTSSATSPTSDPCISRVSPKSSTPCIARSARRPSGWMPP